MIILDTNVVSGLMKPDLNPIVAFWAAQHMADMFVTTAITKAEIYFGIQTMPVGQKRKTLESAADRIFSLNLGGRIIAFDSDAAEKYAVLAAQRRRAGKPPNQSDIQIAAIALVQDMKLATRNTKDFDGCGIKLIDPWQTKIK